VDLTIQKVETPLEQKGRKWKMIHQNILAIKTVRDYSANMNNRKIMY